MTIWHIPCIHVQLTVDNEVGWRYGNYKLQLAPMSPMLQGLSTRFSGIERLTSNTRTLPICNGILNTVCCMEIYYRRLINWVLQKLSTLIGQLATVHIFDWLTKDQQIYKLSPMIFMCILNLTRVYTIYVMNIWFGLR